MMGAMKNMSGEEMKLCSDKVVLPEMKGLTFESSTHTYRFDGLVLPSVTTIMQPLSEAEYGGISDTTLNKAAERGSAVHNAIENWIKYQIDDISPEYQGYYNGFKEWWTKNNPQIVGSEIRFYHLLMKYAGTGDLLCYIGDELNLIDYKTTYALKDMLCKVQLEAYSQILSSHGIYVQKKRILLLKTDGTYDVAEYPIKDAEAWRVFGSLKCVYDYKQSYK